MTSSFWITREGLSPLLSVLLRFSLCYRRAGGSIIIQNVYGYEVEEGADFMLKAAVDAANLEGRLIAPTPYVVDTFPFCRYNASPNTPKITTPGSSETVALLAPRRRLPSLRATRKEHTCQAAPTYTRLGPRANGALYHRRNDHLADGYVMTYLSLKVEGKAQPSFTVDRLTDSDMTPEKEELVRWASNSMFAGTELLILHFASLHSACLPCDSQF